MAKQAPGSYTRGREVPLIDICVLLGSKRKCPDANTWLIFTREQFGEASRRHVGPESTDPETHQARGWERHPKAETRIPTQNAMKKWHPEKEYTCPPCVSAYVWPWIKTLISWSLQIKWTCGFMMRPGRFKSILTNQSSNKAQTTIFNDTYVT